ncbi:MAG: ATP-binding protein [Verrucomicrobiota bacterium]|nr:PAS domain-containing protein [Verrucomicrobiota bacterium]MCC6819628.1 PAS domain-containing protein [Limisphaerales bacterium]
MPPPKSSFLDKVLGRIGRLDAEGLQTVVQRLARERSFLETLFNTIEDGVLVVDETGRILYLNQAVTRLLGVQANTEGRQLKEILPEVDWEKISRLDTHGGPQVLRHEFEVEYPRPRFLRLYAAPLDGEETGSSGMALILHDATEARQKNFEAIESERVQALTLLAASVAHEIGNPLNALHIHLQLMEREVKKLKTSPARGEIAARPRSQSAANEAETADVANKLDQYLSVAKGEINRLDYIVTQFLQAIRPAPLQIKLTTLNAVIQTTLELLRPELDNRGIAIKTKLARHLPATPIDPTQTQQALLNLVKNAMQAMTKGGTLTLQTGETTEAVWVSVADTGGGIPQEQLNRIFEPFYTTKKKGSGLGLMIVQRIVRAHNGRIELESHVGRGTTFRLWLPLHERKPRLLEAPVHD